MGRGGRKPQPRHLKLLKGTLRPHRDNPDAPMALEGALVAPAWMREAPAGKAKKDAEQRRRRQLEHFGRLASALEAIGCASPTFLDAVVLTARVLTDIDELSETLAADGMTFEKEDVNGEPMQRAHPAAQLRTQSLAQAKALLSELGLTPTSLAKASKTASKKPGNGFRDLG